MKINFTELEIEVDFSGETEKINCAKTVANAVKNGTADIGLEDVCREIYHADGEFDFPEEYAAPFLESIMANPNLLAAVKRAIRDLLKPVAGK